MATQIHSPAALERIVVSLLGAEFHLLVSPEDHAIRAAGFVTEARTESMRLETRLAQRDPDLVARGFSAHPVARHPVATAIVEYSEGNLRAIDTLTVSQPATPFRAEVWRALRRVIPGSPVTYSQLAKIAGRPSAVRAAASGCATNLVALVVPCHRIVRSDGSVGKYLFGSELKQRLLAHEAQFANN